MRYLNPGNFLADPDSRSAATLILNDDVDGAEDGLAKGTSTFHNVRDDVAPRVYNAMLIVEIVGKRRGRFCAGDSGL